MRTNGCILRATRCGAYLIARWRPKRRRRADRKRGAGARLLVGKNANTIFDAARFGGDSLEFNAQKMLMERRNVAIGKKRRHANARVKFARVCEPMNVIVNLKYADKHDWHGGA